MTNSPDTTGWNEFPFEYQGVKYISKIAPHSPFVSRIASLPAGVFDTMNRQAIAELVGTTSTRAEIAEKLAKVNENATHAVVALA